MDRTTLLFGGWEPVARILVVGTVAYAVLILLHRVSGTRTLARMNGFDFLVTVALGSAFGRILTARSVAVAEAVTAFTLLVVLQYAVTWLRVRSPTFSRAVTAPPTLLFYQGQLVHEAMRRERITEGDLHTALREHGLGSLEQAEAIVLEPDGRIAVVQSGKAGNRSALEEL